MNERLEAIVRGRVQMVMYRDFASRKARRFGLVGSVQNLTDGSVRVIAEGPKPALERFAIALQRGPMLADVQQVTLAYKAATGEYQTFEITYG